MIEDEDDYEESGEPTWQSPQTKPKAPNYYLCEAQYYDGSSDFYVNRWDGEHWHSGNYPENPLARNTGVIYDGSDGWTLIRWKVWHGRA